MKISSNAFRKSASIDSSSRTPSSRNGTYFNLRKLKTWHPQALTRSTNLIYSRIGIGRHSQGSRQAAVSTARLDVHLSWGVQRSNSFTHQRLGSPQLNSYSNCTTLLLLDLLLWVVGSVSGSVLLATKFIPMC